MSSNERPPLRIGNAGYAILIEIVADRNHEAAADRGGAVAHLLRHRRAGGITIAAPIADHNEIQRGRAGLRRNAAKAAAAGSSDAAGQLQCGSCHFRRARSAGDRLTIWPWLGQTKPAHRDPIRQSGGVGIVMMAMHDQPRAAGRGEVVDHRKAMPVTGRRLMRHQNIEALLRPAARRHREKSNRGATAADRRATIATLAAPRETRRGCGTAVGRSAARRHPGVDTRPRV